MHVSSSSSSSFSVQGNVFSHIDALLGGFRVGGGVHDSYTFQCGLVGSFTSPGIDTGQDQRHLMSHPKDTSWQNGVNGIAKVPKGKVFTEVGLEPSTVRSLVDALTHSATVPLAVGS